jgi:hypothetical protein
MRFHPVDSVLLIASPKASLMALEKRLSLNK